MMLVHLTITLFNHTTILCNTGIYGDRGPRAEYYWLISVAKQSYAAKRICQYLGQLGKHECRMSGVPYNGQGISKLLYEPANTHLRSNNFRASIYTMLIIGWFLSEDDRR